MKKIFKNNFNNILTGLLIFSVMTSWIFSGWPSVWNNPRIPPRVNQVFAATQTKIASTVASVKDGGGYADCDDNSWAIEGVSVQADLQTEDGSEINITSANFDAGDKTYTLILSNFGFDLSTDSIIDGIEVTVKRRSLDGADGKDYHLQLTKSAGTPVASSDDNADTTTVWQAPITAVTYGGATDKWNTTWTEAEIENSGFGLVFAAQAVGENADIWVDQIQVTVHYTSPNITVGTGGTQTANMDVNSSDNYVGGYFTFIRDSGSANITEIIISETGTVNANSNLSNLDIYYETAVSCVYDANETLFGTAASFDVSKNATIAGTMAVGTSQICVYAVLDVGSGASADETILIEITDPSAEVTANAGTVSPGTVVAISGTTTLQAGANSAPSISSLSLNGGSNIILNEGTYRWATSTMTITDADGCDTVSSVTATLYRADISTSGTTCAGNDNNCYIDTWYNACTATTTGNTCDGGVDTSAEYDCGFKIWYIADPTDAGTYVADIWAISATTTDSSSATGNATNTAETIEIISLNALSVTSSINYGTVDANSNTGAFNQTTTVTTTGNTAIDTELSGTDMTGAGTIAVANQKYDIVDISYAPLANNLSGSATTLEITNAKPTSTTTPETDIIYWGLAAPAGSPIGSYSGTNTFGAISD